MELILKNVRLSYPHLFKAKSVMNSDPKYSAAFILDKVKDADQIAKVQAVIESVKAAEKLKVDNDKICLKDGASKDEVYGANVCFINASNDDRPQVVDRGRHAITEDDDIIYGGCYVNAVLNIWAQNNQWGRRVNASLEVVQFVKDGDRFGRKPIDVNEKLPDLSGEDENGSDPLK
jgi:hypothetical protein